MTYLADDQIPTRQDDVPIITRPTNKLRSAEFSNDRKPLGTKVRSLTPLVNNLEKDKMERELSYLP
jgi:hypothetical protein